jgi:hypothetical protein
MVLYVVVFCWNESVILFLEVSRLSTENKKRPLMHADTRASRDLDN